MSIMRHVTFIGFTVSLLLYLLVDAFNPFSIVVFTFGVGALGHTADRVHHMELEADDTPDMTGVIGFTAFFVVVGLVSMLIMPFTLVERFLALLAMFVTGYVFGSAYDQVWNAERSRWVKALLYLGIGTLWAPFLIVLFVLLGVGDSP